jgi:hypothetical protein
VLDGDKYDEAEKIKSEAKKLLVVKGIYVLKKHSFEDYLPLEIVIEVINEFCQKELEDCGRGEAEPISKFDIDDSKSTENQLRRLVHEKYIGVRFEYLKVRLGEEVGRLMVERGLKPDDEIKEILNKANEIASS